MGQWNCSVNQALEALLAAQLAETSLRKQLESARISDEAQGPDDLKRLWLQKSEEAAVARARVDHVLWTGSLDERYASSGSL